MGAIEWSESTNQNKSKTHCFLRVSKELVGLFKNFIVLE